MPNPYEAPGHLKEGAKALLLSGLDLTDLKGISTLLVMDGGRKVPVAAIAGLHLYVNNNRLESLPDEIGALDNRLTALPEGFGRVQIVNQLRVRNNPLTALPGRVRHDACDHRYHRDEHRFGKTIAGDAGADQHGKNPGLEGSRRDRRAQAGEAG